MTDSQRQRLNEKFADYRLTIKTYSTMGALQTLAQYWVENEFIIERAAKEEADLNGPKWVPDSNDDDEVGEYISERDLARYMHDKTLIPMHRYSCVVMLFSTVERELKRLIQNLEKEQGAQKFESKGMRGTYLAKVATFVKGFKGVKFSDCPEYEAICDLQKIRDCIIHSLGEVALSNDKEELARLWRGSKRRRGFAAPLNGHIHIDTQCIKRFLEETWNFFVWIFNTFNWKISAHWQGDVLGKIFKKLKT